MNALDVVLLVLVAAYAVSGYWQGFVAGAFATTGLLLGGLFGIWLSPRLFGESEPSVWVSIGALFVVLLCATFGQAMFAFVGSRIRARITWQPVRALDAVGGAALSVVAVLVVAWALGVAASGARLPWVTEEVRASEVLSRVDEMMPTSAVRALQSFNEVVGTSVFPRYLEPFARERIVEVGPPPARIAGDPQVQAAADGVVKVRGQNACGRGIEGTGFAYAPGRLMTNAHVVAGVGDPQVEVDGEELQARVVHYDPSLDVAVLAVDGLDVPYLRFDRSEKPPGTAAAVLGFPEDGPFDVRGARIRAQQRLRSPTIYGTGMVVREVYSLRSQIRPGNSGGPLVSLRGRVLGVIFAASVTDVDTGYALTADQVARSAALGLASDTAVSTGDCA